MAAPGVNTFPPDTNLKETDNENTKKELNVFTERLKKADTFEEANAIYLEFDKFTSGISDLATIVEVRHTIDTSDKFYDEENEFLSEAFPTIMPDLLAFSDALYSSPFKKQFEEKYGEMLFVSIDLQKKSFCEENIPLMQKQAKLCNEYEKIIASADIPFDGPCAMTQVGMKDGEFVINPSQEVWDNGDLQLTVASTREKVIMIEAGANGVCVLCFLQRQYSFIIHAM